MRMFLSVIFFFVACASICSSTHDILIHRFQVEITIPPRKNVAPVGAQMFLFPLQTGIRGV
jgi:hypothetical protein